MFSTSPPHCNRTRHNVNSLVTLPATNVFWLIRAASYSQQPVQPESDPVLPQLRGDATGINRGGQIMCVSREMAAAVLCGLLVAGCTAQFTRENANAEIFKSTKSVDAVAGCLGQRWLAQDLPINSIKTANGYTLVSERGSGAFEAPRTALAVVDVDRAGNGTIVTFRTAFAAQRSNFIPTIQGCV